MLAEYDINDRDARRQLPNVLVALDLLEGKDAEAGHFLDEIAALEEKPAQKHVSALLWRTHEHWRPAKDLEGVEARSTAAENGIGVRLGEIEAIG